MLLTSCLPFCVCVFLRFKNQLQFSMEERLVLAKDANKKDEDTYDIYDPRNPINKRRRGEESQKNSNKSRKHDRAK